MYRLNDKGKYSDVLPVFSRLLTNCGKIPPVLASQAGNIIREFTREKFTHYFFFMESSEVDAVGLLRTTLLLANATIDHTYDEDMLSVFRSASRVIFQRGNAGALHEQHSELLDMLRLLLDRIGVAHDG